MKFLVQIIIWLVGFFVLWKIPVCKKSQGQNLQNQNSRSTTRVSVIIPARNEEGVLNKLLETLTQQTIRPHEIIVVNDGSTDHTGPLARQAGAKVVDLDALPDGWVGKTWACYNGAKTASGNYFLFLDADTWLEKDGLEKIIACENQHPGIITIAPYHIIREPYENLSLFFNVMAGAGLRTFTLLGDRIEPAGLFGPCFYTSRENYYAIDGHASVRESIVEDVDIGRTFVEAGIPLHGFGGNGTISLRMYPLGLNQLVRGWLKNIGVGAKLTSLPFVILISLWFGGAFKTAFDLLVSLLAFRQPAPKLSVLYAAYASQIWWMSRRVGNFHPLASVLFPIPLFFSGYIYLRSYLRYAMGKQVKWKGRSLSTEDTAR
jgi:4,4'-diaponeurosporenoate glycosyltransferase